MNIRDKILIEKAWQLHQVMEQQQTQTYLKSTAVPNYTYSYSHKVDLGQGRTRFIHLNFKLNAETNQIELVNESVSDT